MGLDESWSLTIDSRDVIDKIEKSTDHMIYLC